MIQLEIPDIPLSLNQLRNIHHYQWNQMKREWAGLISLVASLDEADRLSSSRLTWSDKERIKEGLSGLTDLERDVYLMARGRCLSREQIASFLGVSKGTINKMLTRADEKVAHRSQTSLFCLPNAN
ncbi:Sigma-70, region 4 [Marininema mesophilum]|uniref:Sigma-70, region 4 n=1 Tax=Marininema mesophilum TaxID=1048340 RepID=A0A1H2V7C3_9BACL|nr:sigma factor-like helix-turn-helix DNA-binding protein [Marininema mesophilum]SDW64201.1 Sigma-70, region 4 [Marininema mesophilum]